MPSLRRRAEILELKKQGRFFHVNSWLAVNFKKNDKNSLRWAWTLPKKIGKAVVRNRLKRWGREFLNDFKQKEVDINFIFKIKTPDFYRKLSHHEFDKVFQKIFRSKIS